jgi:hypothetical protein
MMLPPFLRGILYTAVFLGIMLGLLGNSPIFWLVALLLVGYLINVITWGYYFYRATSILILAVLLLVFIGFRNNITDAFLMVFMAVDVVL